MRRQTNISVVKSCCLFSCVFMQFWRHPIHHMWMCAHCPFSHTSAFPQKAPYFSWCFVIFKGLSLENEAENEEAVIVQPTTGSATPAQAHVYQSMFCATPRRAQQWQPSRKYLRQQSWACSDAKAKTRTAMRFFFLNTNIYLNLETFLNWYLWFWFIRFSCFN